MKQPDHLSREAYLAQIEQDTKVLEEGAHRFAAEYFGISPTAKPVCSFFPPPPGLAASDSRRAAIAQAKAEYRNSRLYSEARGREALNIEPTPEQTMDLDRFRCIVASAHGVHPGELS